MPLHSTPFISIASSFAPFVADSCASSPGLLFPGLGLLFSSTHSFSYMTGLNSWRSEDNELDPFLNELTKLYEQSKTSGTRWVTLKRSTLQREKTRKTIEETPAQVPEHSGIFDA